MKRPQPRRLNPRRQTAAGPPPGAYARALARLARRDHTIAELRSVLLGREHAPDEVEAAIARLGREGYLDDRGYAERFARSRLQHQGLGRARIRQALRQRGVPGGEIDAGLRRALGEVDEKGVLRAVARRYWKLHARVEPERRLPRLWAFLLRRGFPPPLVRDELGSLWPRWADALAGLDPAPDAPDDADCAGDDR